MKKYFYLIGIAMFYAATTFAQNVELASNESSKAVFTWESQAVNLGKIPQGIPAEATFTFTNTGTSPIVISDVKPSCGCTATEWPKEPVMPGKSAVIKAKYNAASAGNFNKTVKVTANTTQSITTLTIRGEVVAKTGNQ
ncbi:DUF1573 domain-containing protein [Flexithrix dorotheae]|uniref:DUF1573 domain-containing protein n=1 Tax=Flexithrix dorotheae TaxID=70993 RepID=UPI000376D90D|nr:DUF1573 domain-containing protein [Flexithrix dorotheae]